MDALTIILLVIAAFFILFLGYKIGSMAKDQEWIEKLPKVRKDSVDRSRSVLAGQFSEQLAPYLPGFPYSPSECRFIGKPIDILVFKGLDSKDPNEVVFLEVKTGKSTLSPVEKKLKDAVESGRVRWEEYRPDTFQK